MSVKVTSQFLWFSVTMLCDWLKSEVELKPIVICLHVSASTSGWFIGFCASVLIGQKDNFDLDFTTVN